jgi:sphingomyelin phosphodiesterase acid-like 3
VYKAADSLPLGAAWNQEYAFDATYHVPDFSAASLRGLIAAMRGDSAGTGADSKAYEEHYAKNGEPSSLAAGWPAYVCSLDHPTAAGFKACACGSSTPGDPSSR